MLVCWSLLVEHIDRFRLAEKQNANVIIFKMELAHHVSVILSDLPFYLRVVTLSHTHLNLPQRAASLSV